MSPITELRPRLYELAAKLTSDVHLREDLVGEMTLFVLERMRRFEGKPDAYVLQACKNYAIDTLRRGKSVDGKQRESITVESLCSLCEGLGVDECLLSLTGVCDDPERLVIVKDIVERTARRLTPIQREVFYRLLEGYRPAEIASLRGVSKPTVTKSLKAISKAFYQVWGDKV